MQNISDNQCDSKQSFYKGTSNKKTHHGHNGSTVEQLFQIINQQSIKSNQQSQFTPPFKLPNAQQETSKKYQSNTPFQEQPLRIVKYRNERNMSCLVPNSYLQLNSNKSNLLTEQIRNYSIGKVYQEHSVNLTGTPVKNSITNFTGYNIVDITNIGKPRCQSKRLQNYCQSRRQDASVKENKQQSESESNLISYSNDSEIQSKQFTQRKNHVECMNHCQCDCQKNSSKKERTKTQFKLEFDSMQQKMTYLNEDFQFSRKRSSTFNNSSFEQSQSIHPVKIYVNTGVQTAINFKDYKQKYKEMVEKVRNNELQNLDLRNENIKLQKQYNIINNKYQEEKQKCSHLENMFKKGQENVKHQIDLNTQLQQKNNRFDQQLREISIQLNEKDLKIKKITEERDRILQDNEYLEKENSSYKQSLSQFNELEIHIQDLEKIYSHTFTKINPLLEKQSKSLSQLKGSIINMNKIIEKQLENKEIPLNLLVQHRQKITDFEINLLSSISERNQVQANSEQIVEIINKNNDYIDQILVDIRRQFDKVAEHFVHDISRSLATYME